MTLYSSAALFFAAATICGLVKSKHEVCNISEDLVVAYVTGSMIYCEGMVNATGNIGERAILEHMCGVGNIGERGKDIQYVL